MSKLVLDGRSKKARALKARAALRAAAPAVEPTIGGTGIRGTYIPVDVAADPIHAPSHYTAGGIETIDYLRAKLSPEQFKGYCRGNALKYLSRAELKGGAEDYRKAAVYLDWLNDAERAA
jgi:hypothetical protein